MGGKQSKNFLCCRNSISSTPSSKKNKNTATQSFQTDHYQNIEDYLVDKSFTNLDSMSSKLCFQPLFFDFTKCSLSSLPTERTQGTRSNSIDKYSKFDNLIETSLDFFESKPYKVAQSFLMQSQLLIEQKDQYERAYIESKDPSELTIYLKKESTSDTKYHTQVNEFIFNNVQSLDQYVKSIEEKINHQMDHQIESSKILFQQKLDEGFSVQIIYVVFKKLNYQKSRDLVYLKVQKIIDQNTCIQAYQSIQVKQEQKTLVEIDSEQNLILAVGGTSNITTVQSQTSSPNLTSKRSIPQSKQKGKSSRLNIRKASCANPTTLEEKYDRALLYMGGKKITYDNEKQQIFVQEMQSLDMKIDTQHIFQRQVMVYQTKQIFDKIKATLHQTISE